MTTTAYRTNRDFYQEKEKNQTHALTSHHRRFAAV